MKFLSLPTWILGLWDQLRTSFWFLPSTMAGTAVALSFGLVYVDTSLGSDSLRRFGLIHGFGPEGARAVLSIIAGSMITVAGLTFSITMLTLQLASSQFGPRLLRTLMRDRGNQFVLGTFTSTFLYCLLVLRTVRETDGFSFVPNLSVAFGVALATLSLAVLIYFIHHVANSIRIETVLADLGRETRAAIERLYPAEIGKGSPRKVDDGGEIPGREFDKLSLAISSDASGYVQHVDEVSLMKIAIKHNLVICLDARPGSFVTDMGRILRAAPRDSISDEIASSLRDTFVIGPDRTPSQDLEFSLRRIVEIAQRAMSPGTNDPTTALYCIDRLEEALCRLAQRPIPAPSRADPQGIIRIITTGSTFQALACPSIAAIARYGMKDADVARKLQELIEAVSSNAASPDARNAIIQLGVSIQSTYHSENKTFDRDI